VHLIDEQDDLAVAFHNLADHGLEPVLELAAIFGPGDHRAQIQGDHPLVLQDGRHVTVDHAQRQSLDNGGLAHSGLTDEHGVVFRAAGQNLHDSADFFIAADDRIDLALASQFDEVAAIALQSLVGILGVLAVHSLMSANVLHGREDHLACGTGDRKHLLGL